MNIKTKIEGSDKKSIVIMTNTKGSKWKVLRG